MLITRGGSYEGKVEVEPDSDDVTKLDDGTKLKDDLKEGTKHEAIEVQLDFNLKTTTTEELDDMIVSGKWLERLSARRVIRHRAYDPLLQSTLKAKKAKAKAKSAAQRYKQQLKQRQRHSTRGEALKVLQEEQGHYSKKQLLDSLIPGTEPVFFNLMF